MRLGTLISVAIVSVFVLGASAGWADVLPSHEVVMIKDIARRYRLTAEGTRLLMAIRKIENGRPGLEFGIGGPVKNHPSRRYTDGKKSFIVQGEWAAGTIAKRFTGDIDAFALRYCPRNHKQWAKLARKIMRQIEREEASAAKESQAL